MKRNAWMFGKQWSARQEMAPPGNVSHSPLKRWGGHSGTARAALIRLFARTRMEKSAGRSPKPVLSCVILAVMESCATLGTSKVRFEGLPDTGIYICDELKNSYFSGITLNETHAVHNVWTRQLRLITEFSSWGMQRLQETFEACTR